MNMPNQHGGGRYWQDKAEEARAMAGGFRDSAARLAMLEIAANLEVIAARVEAMRAHLKLVGGEDLRKAS